MKTWIIAGIATILVITVATVSTQPELELTAVPNPTTTVVEAAPAEKPPPEQPVADEPSQEELEEAWSKTAFSRLTTEHQLYLNVEEQRIFQACVFKALKAQHAYEKTGSAKAKADAARFSAEVARWEKQVADAQSE